MNRETALRLRLATTHTTTPATMTRTATTTTAATQELFSCSDSRVASTKLCVGLAIAGDGGACSVVGTCAGGDGGCGLLLEPTVWCAGVGCGGG